MGHRAFSESFYKGETARYYKGAQNFGVPLDSREMHTKSDWSHWVACFGDNKDFRFFTDLMHKAYSTMRHGSRVPMTDRYYADTALLRGFKRRTVRAACSLNCCLIEKG